MDHTLKIKNFKKVKRNFLPEVFEINKWEDVKPYYEVLEKENIHSEKTILEDWLTKVSELDAFVSEALAWRYIRMTSDTKNESLLDKYREFITEIEPQINTHNNVINKKLIDSFYNNQLEDGKYFTYLRSIRKDLDLYREENIPLFAEISKEAQKYNAIMGEQSITHNGKILTLQSAALLLKSNDRKVREEIYMKVQFRKDEDEEKLNELFNSLLSLRHQVAINAGFENYRAYKFQELGRFDYSAADCINFHEAIRKHIVPLSTKLEETRKDKLNLDTYRPWDTDVDPEGHQALRPFGNGDELLNKTIACFNKIDPYFGECLLIMKELGNLDLESRIGKAPGGYNYPLDETGVPFIFMNAAGSHRDLVTMVHEGGHALHSFLSQGVQLTGQKRVPAEVAELASMSMELISMENWDVFYSDLAELKRAKKEHLEKILKTIPWIASIDKFQHFLYENPKHSLQERYNHWLTIMGEFGTGVVDYSGLEKYLSRSWQSQLHIFEVPFYYIEYGMAQLGALAIWRNYKINPTQTLNQYKEALSLGYTKTIGEIYQTAGIRFDFSGEYVKELSDFIESELTNYL